MPRPGRSERGVLPPVDDATGLELGGRKRVRRVDHDVGRHAAGGLDPVAHDDLDRAVIRLDLERQHVELGRALDQDPVLGPDPGYGPERVLDHVGIDVDATHEQHVVDAAVDAVGEAPVGASARARLRRHAGEVARPEPDHGLRGPLEVRVHRHAFALRDDLLGPSVHELRVDDVLPEVHAGALGAFRARHPRRHLGHRSRVYADRVERLLEPALRGRDAGARLAGEEHDAEAEARRVDRALPRHPGEMERVGRRAVEDRRTDEREVVERTLGLPRQAGAEREHPRAERLGAGERPPAPQVEAEERGDEHGVRGSDAEAPHDAGVRCADPRPVVARDREGGRPAGRARGPVDARDRVRRAADVGAERRVLLLVAADGVLRHEREAGQVIDASERLWPDAGLGPQAPIERGALVAVGDLRLQLRENDLGAYAGVHRLLGPPVGALRLREDNLAGRRPAHA